MIECPFGASMATSKVFMRVKFEKARPTSYNGTVWIMNVLQVCETTCSNIWISFGCSELLTNRHGGHFAIDWLEVDSEAKGLIWCVIAILNWMPVNIE